MILEFITDILTHWTMIAVYCIAAVMLWCVFGFKLWESFLVGIQRYYYQRGVRYHFDHVEFSFCKVKHLFFVFLCGPAVWVALFFSGLGKLLDTRREKKTGKERLLTRFLRLMLEDRDSDMRSL